MGNTHLAACDREELSVFLLSHASRLPVLSSGANRPADHDSRIERKVWKSVFFLRTRLARILAASPIHTSTTPGKGLTEGNVFKLQKLEMSMGKAPDGARN